MRKLITILTMVLSLQISAQTFEQVKTYIDNQIMVENVKVGSKWVAIYRNENMIRESLTDSIILTKQVNKRTKILDSWLKDSYKIGDSTFVHKVGKYDFRQALLVNGAWEYQQKVDIWVQKSIPINKEKLIIKYVIKANELNTPDSTYLKGLRYIKYGDEIEIDTITL